MRIVKLSGLVAVLLLATAGVLLLSSHHVDTVRADGVPRVLRPSGAGHKAAPRDRSASVKSRVEGSSVPAGTPSYLLPCYEDSAAINQQPCIAAGEARASQVASQYPSSLSDGASYLTAAQAEQDAIDGGALDPGAQPSSAAQFTTYSTAAVAMGESSQANPYVDPSTPVWLVTVHATPSVLPSPPTGGAIAAPTVYSEILDAINGNVIDFCGGCDSVTS